MCIAACGHAAVVTSLFDRNAAGGSGGAISGAAEGCDGARLVLQSSLLVGNTAQVDGGGVAMGARGHTTLRESTLSENRARSGGAVSVLTPPALLDIRTVHGRGNAALRGAGVFSAQPLPNGTLALNFTDSVLSGSSFPFDPVAAPLGYGVTATPAARLRLQSRQAGSSDILSLRIGQSLENATLSVHDAYGSPVLWAPALLQFHFSISGARPAVLVGETVDVLGGDGTLRLGGLRVSAPVGRYVLTGTSVSESGGMDGLLQGSVNLTLEVSGCRPGEGLVTATSGRLECCPLLSPCVPCIHLAG